MKLFRNILLASGAVCCFCGCMRPFEADEPWIREQLETVDDTRYNIYGKMLLSAGRVAKVENGENAVIYLKPSATILAMGKYQVKSGKELDKSGLFPVVPGNDRSILDVIKTGTNLVVLTRCGLKTHDNELQDWRIYYPEESGKKGKVLWHQLLN